MMKRYRKLLRFYYYSHQFREDTGCLRRFEFITSLPQTDYTSSFDYFNHFFCEIIKTSVVNEYVNTY